MCHRWWCTQPPLLVAPEMVSPSRGLGNGETVRHRLDASVRPALASTLPINAVGTTLAPRAEGFINSCVRRVGGHPSPPEVVHCGFSFILQAHANRPVSVSCKPRAYWHALQGVHAACDRHNCVAASESHFAAIVEAQSTRGCAVRFFRKPDKKRFWLDPYKSRKCQSRSYTSWNSRKLR